MVSKDKKSLAKISKELKGIGKKIGESAKSEKVKKSADVLKKTGVALLASAKAVDEISKLLPPEKKTVIKRKSVKKKKSTAKKKIYVNL